jgi:hypothetical protein
VAYALFETIAWAVGHTMANRLIAVPWPAFLATLAGPVRTQLLFLAAVLAIRALLHHLRLGDIPALAAGAALSLPAYAGLLWWADRPLRRELAGFWRKRS